MRRQSSTTFHIAASQASQQSGEPESQHEVVDLTDDAPAADGPAAEHPSKSAATAGGTEAAKAAAAAARPASSTAAAAAGAAAAARAAEVVAAGHPAVGGAAAARAAAVGSPADGDLQMHLAGFRLLRVRHLSPLANRCLMLELHNVHTQPLF